MLKIRVFISHTSHFSVPFKGKRNCAESSIVKKVGLSRHKDLDRERERVTISYSSAYAFFLSDLLWQLIALTLFLDPLIVLLFWSDSSSDTPFLEDAPFLEGLNYEYLILGFLLLAFYAVIQKTIATIPANLFSQQLSQQSLLRKYRFHLLGLGGAILLGAIYIGYSPITLIVIFLTVVYPLFGSETFKNLFGEGQHDESQTARLERGNAQLVLLGIIPPLIARCYGIITLISSLGTTNPVANGTITSVATILLMIVLRPEREHFITNCRQCSTWTSMTLAFSSGCPACQPNAFRASHSIEAHTEKMGRLQAYFTNKAREKAEQLSARSHISG